MTCVQMRQNCTGTSLPMPGKPDEYLSTTSQRLAAQELTTRCLASAEHRLLSEASPDLQKLEKIPSQQRVLDWLEAHFPNQSGILAKENEQEENNRPGAARARGPEEEEQHAPLGPKAQEDMKAASPVFGDQVTAAGAESQAAAWEASPVFGEQVTASEAESQAAARHSPCSRLSPLSSWPEAPGPSGTQAVHRQHPSRFWRVLRVLIRLCWCARTGGWHDN